MLLWWPCSLFSASRWHAMLHGNAVWLFPTAHTDPDRASPRHPLSPQKSKSKKKRRRSSSSDSSGSDSPSRADDAPASGPVKLSEFFSS